MAQPPSFAAMLKQYRAAAGLTQEQLAERAGLSVRGISDLERGINRRPQRDTLAQLIEALQLSQGDRATLEVAVGVGRSREGQADDGIIAGTLLPLVGRSVELTALSHHLREGEPRVLVLAGEPGIGKTRLLQEAWVQGKERGFTVMYGGCRRVHGEVPYTPLVEAIARQVRKIPTHALSSVLDGCSWLARLLPELETVVRDPLPILAPGQERRLVFASVTRFLSQASGSAGTHLLLDDLQWAAPDALDLLTALVDPESRVPIRMVCAYRDTEIGPSDALAMTLGELAHAGLAHQIQLGPLHMTAAQEMLESLVAASVDGSTRDRILRRAGGLPFFLVSCAQGLQSHVAAGEDMESIPWDLAQGIRQRIATLTPSSRDVLHAAGVVGRVASRELLRAVVDMSDDVFADALDMASQRGLLIEHGDDGYGFSHDVIREVIERDLGAARRALLHGRIAEALERGREGSSADILAYHFSRGGLSDKALLYMEQAGDEAQAQYAHAAAEESYRTLLRRLEALGPDSARARVREKLGTTLTSLGRYSDALRMLEDASDLYGAGNDWAGVGRVTAHAGQVHFFQGSAAEGLVRLQTVIEVIQQNDEAINLAALYAATADLYFACGRYTEELQAAERAAELASAVDDPLIHARAEVSRGLALISMGRLGEALPILEEVVSLAQSVGDLATLSRALENIANVHWSRGEFDEHRAYLQHALDVAEQVADLAASVGLVFMLGANSLMVCDWQGAEVYFDRVDSLTQRLEHSRVSMFGLFGKGALCVARGDWHTAQTYLQECIDIAERTGNLQMLSVARHHWAEMVLLSGRAHDVAESFGQLVTRLEIGDRGMSHVYAGLARAYLQAGSIEAADEAATESVRLAVSANDYIARVEALRAQGTARTAQHRWDEAEQLFGEVHAMVQGVMPYDDGRTLYEWGIMSLRAGKLDDASDHLSEACELFQRLGAEEHRERATRMLAEIHEIQSAR